MTPEDIQDLFKRTDGVLLPGPGDGDDEPVLTDEERQYRIAHLRAVLLEAHNAWVSGSEDLDRIAEKLGDGSRHPLWRSPIGASGILSFFLGILPTPGLRPLLRSHALRLIGNSCADTDENRARVVESGRIHAIIELLYDDSLLPFVIPVLYNVLVDYEPVQLQASEAGLSQKLMEILGGPRLEACRLYVNLICKILALLITQEPESRNGPPATPLILLSVATNRQHPVDLEDFSGLAAVALAYLTHESFQKYILAGLPLLLTAFSMSYTHFDPEQAQDPDDAAQLRQVRNAFVPVLADISALPDFVPGLNQGGAGLLTHPIFQTLQSWLHGPPAHANLQTAACLALGNLARNDVTCVMFVRDAQVHQPLINLLSRCLNTDTTSNAQLTHAALSFLKNLAIPAPNKPQLGRLLEPNMLPRLWSTWGDSQPQTQFTAVSLGRLLLVGCPPNVRRLCAPLSLDPDSPAHDRSNLHVLTALFERSDAEPTKMEAARAVATVCRILHSTPVSPVLPDDASIPSGAHVTKRAKRDSTSLAEQTTIFRTETHTSFSPSSAQGLSPVTSMPQSPESHSSASTTSTASSQTRRARFYSAHDLAIPLSFLIKQTRFPALRSEAWFVLALMCRSADGARVVQAALQSFEACRALVESVTGRDMADGHDLLLAASSSPPAEGQEDAPNSHVRSGSDGFGSGSGLSAASGIGMGIEGLGLGSLEPQQVDPATQANMARIDRENGLCMVAELVKNHSADLLPLRKNIYEQLLLTGGELVLHAREDNVGNAETPLGGGGSVMSPSQMMQQQMQMGGNVINISTGYDTNMGGMGAVGFDNIRDWSTQ
ncbi:armadillo-type protein [Coniella lustricola]|uniref:Armadillo-type protein n=1 Tax=Coniella lustricola TaxID=2025994 RepID=A0A2T3A703_9PEZI|nr:armadillo-type protein [Coniella lustricola]